MIPSADIVIIGAGAAGLAAGIFAAATNRSLKIVLLDGTKSLGAKILVSGGGRCNVTNQTVTASDFHGERKSIDRILRRFDEQHTIRWFESLGISLQTELTGKVFPTSNKARTILTALLNRCQELSVMILTQHRVQSIIQHGQGFSIQHPQGLLQARKVIVATGGRSLPKAGSDGSGWDIVQQLGHSVTPTYPALVPLLLDPTFFHAALSGISHEAMLTTRVNEKIVDRRTGSLLWTHFGISGPMVLDASRFWVLAAEQGHQVQLYLNCFPDSTDKEVEKWLIRAAAQPGRQTVQSCLAKRLPSRVARQFAQFLDPDMPNTPVNLLAKDSRKTLVHALTNLSFPVIGSRGWNFSEVTAGGVPLQEINTSTMGSKKIPGLYLIGEMLDCDGRIGGFNFQWAWSTGYIAGCHASRSLTE